MPLKKCGGDVCVWGGVLFAQAPFTDDQQHIVDAYGAVGVNILGAIFIGDAITPSADDREDVVHIDLAVTVGVGAFTLIGDAVVVGVLRG
ncbi:MAG: hypothetical protein VX527_10510, partial [Planctomycetota bacterium]|nr:hypothetical protein [Planctomycetota bacterium]